MIVEQSLLDFLALQMKCEYLSDLQFLSREQRRYLAWTLEPLVPRTEDLAEWNNALGYLTGKSPEETAQAAKEQLVKSLQEP